MKELIDDVLVPMERVKEFRDGKKRESQRKFFPGYVLIHMVMNEKTWLFVRHTDRVLGFVGGNIDHPMPITDAEAERILGRLKETENAPTQKTKFEVGEKVRAFENENIAFRKNLRGIGYIVKVMRIAGVGYLCLPFPVISKKTDYFFVVVGYGKAFL